MPPRFPSALANLNPVKVWLTGPMGSGKSSVGEILAQSPEINAPLIDMDARIVEEQKKPISQIFKEVQEEGFRKIERKHLREIEKILEDRVVSTGGGAPSYRDNMEIMNRRGITVFLDGEPELLADRTIQDEADKKPDRPLMKGLSREERVKKFGDMLVRRRPFYEKAKIHIKLGDKSIEAIVAEILVGMKN